MNVLQRHLSGSFRENSSAYIFSYLLSILAPFNSLFPNNWMLKSNKSPARFLQISIPLQSRLVKTQQLPGFLQGNLAGADGSLYVLAHARRQFISGILHIVQHLADRIPLDDRVDVDLAAFIKTDVNGVGVAEQVVQVAKDFLIRAEEESPQIVRFA